MRFKTGCFTHGLEAKKGYNFWVMRLGLFQRKLYVLSSRENTVRAERRVDFMIFRKKYLRFLTVKLAWVKGVRCK